MTVGSGVEQPDEVHPDVGRAGPFALLFEDQLLDREAPRPPPSTGQSTPA